ncbi:uncharacterized protein FOBCDRAFT_149385 [Fusarium oxysporum Fo47]|uniref:uncharacterized protein n=1 Tax=Fusarium oxysporum Fo47 TaxID=660027 RepID=UPI002869C192|nr:uncharacterized protein FOBCDRAFT_149385 [Fusarium oxysporum Fo47]WJG37415.1 hypothetical protein FOBCDRAFT_149385 [Fusarium oxysporum Fo47]
MLGPESNERMGFPPILVHERCVVIQQSRGEEAQAAAWLHYASRPPTSVGSGLLSIKTDSESYSKKPERLNKRI